MLSKNSNHLLPLREDVPPGLSQVVTHYRRWLNVGLLLDMLRASLKDEDKSNSTHNEEITPANNRKRPAPTLAEGRRKRRRRRYSPEPQQEVDQVLIDAEGENATYRPLYSHTFDIQYTKSTHGVLMEHVVHDGLAKDIGWTVQEDQLIEWVQDNSQEDEPKILDLDEIFLARVGPYLYGFDKNVSKNRVTSLLGFPWIDNDFRADIFDAKSPFVRDPLAAAAVLEDVGRVQMKARLRVALTPQQEDDDVLPIHVLVQIDVSAVSPVIFQPLEGAQKLSAIAIEDAQRRVLDHVFPANGLHNFDPNISTDVPLLYSVLHPAPSLGSASLEAHYQPAELRPTLLPFQRRSVAWLLSREGKAVSEDLRVVPLQRTKDDLPPLWEKVSVSDKESWYFNRISGELSQELPEDDRANVFGGILAEEPGLGKTLESIALVLLNPADPSRNPKNATWNPDIRVHVKEVKTTLIVTPPSLAQQWADELKKHSPTLKVLVYDGWQKIHTNGVEWARYVHDYDVCITTYVVLQHDLGVARPPLERPRRETAIYANMQQRQRSPLVVCKWYRVIMDEVQMVGGGKAEEMVSLIPRLSSFAVSGTPARHKVADLIHVISFLRVEPIMSRPRYWTRLLKPLFVKEFYSLFKTYAVRTMKAAVQDELTIPKQTRFLVPIELGPVERHVYEQNFEQTILDLGLDSRGVAVHDNWQINVVALRTWLRRLRGLCTHPQVGQLQAHADKIHKPGVLKSMGEVLEDMQEKSWVILTENRKSKVLAQTTVAKLVQHDEGDPRRLARALEIFLAAENDAKQLIADVEAVIQREEQKAKTLKQQAAKANEDDENGSMSQNKGKGKATEASDRDSPEGQNSSPHNLSGEEHNYKMSVLHARLRDCRLALHKVQFFLGDTYHNLQKEREEQEAYAVADKMRHTLLQSTETAASRAMEQLLRETEEKRLALDELLIPSPFFGQGGIKSHAKIEEANELIDGLLNKQTEVLWEWRKSLIDLLTKPLSSAEGDQADGDEFNRSIETQHVAEVYLEVYAALLADRREFMTSERTLLATLDVKEKKARKTKAASKAVAAAQDLDVVMAVVDEDPKPELEVLRKELTDTRKALTEGFDTTRAVRSIMVDLNNIAASISNKDDPEKLISKDASTRLRQLVADQGKLMEKLQADLIRLRKAYNERVSFFRQLQEISDTVVDVQWENPLDVAIQEQEAECISLEEKIKKGRAHQRFLDYMVSSQEEGLRDEDDDCCVLCKCEFTRGYITQCAHIYCEGCMKDYLLRNAGSGCPICRAPIDKGELQRFSINEQKEKEESPQKVVNGEPVPRSTRQTEYNYIDTTVLADIRTIESHGSYGSKIETLVRHLLYIQLTEPGAKSIVFSAWADSLHIISHALTHNNIQHLRIDQNSSKKSAAMRFQNNPDIQVLLLHGERENAGLNVTCASRVFLLESVVHHGFEIQAIARIDRMGQTKQTEVYCYYAEDTVERNILDLAARQGLSLYTKDHSSGTLTNGLVQSQQKIDAPSRNKRSQKDSQKGDFVHKTDDMLAILFPHLFEDVEYLLPPEAIAASIATNTNLPCAAGPSGSNTIAGPSRLG